MNRRKNSQAVSAAPGSQAEDSESTSRAAQSLTIHLTVRHRLYLLMALDFSTLTKSISNKAIFLENERRPTVLASNIYILWNKKNGLGEYKGKWLKASQVCIYNEEELYMILWAFCLEGSTRIMEVWNRKDIQEKTEWEKGKESEGKQGGHGKWGWRRDSPWIYMLPIC